jgi:anti-anti-sigma regulatory factor
MRWIRFWSISDECWFLYGTSEAIAETVEETGMDELDGWAYASPEEISKLKGLEDEGLVQL